MIEDEKSAVMVRSLVAMAHGLGLKVVAEGVETPAQAELLSACKCDYAQGYLFGRPLPVREFESIARPRCYFGRWNAQAFGVAGQDYIHRPEGRK